MADGVDIKKLEQQDKELNRAVEEMRIALNTAIRAHGLAPMDILILLSRLSAGYIHQIEKSHPTNVSVEEIEERFHFMVESHLADLDLHDIGVEMEKMKREELN